MAISPIIFLYIAPGGYNSMKLKKKPERDWNIYKHTLKERAFLLSDDYYFLKYFTEIKSNLASLIFFPSLEWSCILQVRDFVPRINISEGRL